MQVFRRLKCVLERQNKWVRELSHDLSLCYSVSDLVVGDHELLVDRLHRIQFTSGDMFYPVDFAKRSLTELVENFKTGKFCWRFMLGRGWLAGCEGLVVAEVALLIWVLIYDFGDLHELILNFDLLLWFFAVVFYLLESITFLNDLLLVQ